MQKLKVKLASYPDLPRSGYEATKSLKNNKKQEAMMG